MDTTTTSITIDCDQCVMRSTDACSDCVVTHVLDGPQALQLMHCGSHSQPTRHQATSVRFLSRRPPDTVVLDIAEHRAMRLFAEAGMVPTLRHRATSIS